MNHCDNISRLRVAIGFIIRDGEKYLMKNFTKLESFMRKNFYKYKFFYIENDSKDDTRRLLNGLENNYNVFGKQINIHDKFSTDLCVKKKNCVKRFRLLANLRNELVSLIKEDA